MTLQENIEKYAGIVNRLSAEELKANPVFMKACRENEDFKLWVLDRKPTMASVKQPKMKFRGIAPPKGQVEVESPQNETQRVRPEQKEELSKTGQIMKDLKAYRKSKGFI